MTSEQNYINHIVILADASASMKHLEETLVKVTDNLILDLAAQSKQMDQETRITIYSFDTEVKCLIWDMDVLRVPSIATRYKVNPDGWTALIDATLTAITELELVTQIHGDHSFLVYVVTDGVENKSKNMPGVLGKRIAALPTNWTLGALVPNFQGVASAKAYGFPAGNVITWDTSSAQGMQEVVEKISAATTSYMTSRSTGTRSTQNLFGGGQVLNKATVAAAGLKPLNPAAYHLVPVVGIPEKTEIAGYINGTLGLKFTLGRNFYQLSKPEKIQPQKDLAIMDKRTKEIFLGREARKLLGLPDMEVRVKPDFNPEYLIFVQSNSTNRHLVLGTSLLILK